MLLRVRPIQWKEESLSSWIQLYLKLVYLWSL